MADIWRIIGVKTMAQIITYPDKRLTEKCATVSPFNADARLVAKRLGSFLAANGGMGVAAPQIGSNMRIIALLCGEGSDPLVIVNPEIFSADGSTTEEEGCLSIPGVYFKITRPQKIALVGQNIDGEKITLDAEGYLARAVAHEIDHLDGVLIWDNLPQKRRDAAIKSFSDFSLKTA